MHKVKISEIAKELGMKSKDVIESAKELGLNPKAHSSSVTETEAEKIIQFMQTGQMPNAKTETNENKEKEAPKKVENKEVKEEPKKAEEKKEEAKEEPKKVEAKKIENSASARPKRGKLRIVRKNKREEPKKEEPKEEPRQEVIQETKPKAPVNKKPENQNRQSQQDDFKETKKHKKQKKTPAVAHDHGEKLNILEDRGGFDRDVNIDDEEDVVILDINTEEKPYEDTQTKKKDITAHIRTNKVNSHFQQRQSIRRSGRRKSKPKPKINNEKVTSVTVNEDVRVYEFAEKINVPVAKIIGELFKLGNMMTKNDFLDKDSIEILADVFEVSVETTNEHVDELDYMNAYEEQHEEVTENSTTRAPVITIMGHVDHGKTSLLDKIRDSRVASGEAGGITQHVGAYMIEKDGKDITFIDTPGHEAFTEMRARGASVTDIVIIVVAADDGVKPQTLEAIAHAKAADVPIIVAVNKIDKEAANIDRVKTQMAEHDMTALDWGGEYEFIGVSAHTGEGIEELLETILLQSEIMELQADATKKAKATVIESSLEKGKGPVATVVVQDGTLKVGDTIVADTTFGRVRAIVDDLGKPIKELKPSQPGRISGLDDVPSAGSVVVVMDNEKEAREIATKRKEYARTKELSKSTKVSLEELSSLVAEGKLKSLPVIIKADVQGSLEAIKGSLEKLKNEEVKVNVIHSAVGGITESDISLATASENSVILGFNVRPTGSVKSKAKEEGVDIKTYSIIYDLIDDIKALLTGMMSPIIREENTGQAEVRDTFTIPKVGTVAGCFVSDGTVIRGGLTRIIRDGVVVYDNAKITSLKRFKDDAKEVAKGYECGIMIENYNDVKVGDVIELEVMMELF
jgi:translation initiation factor IF-2